MLKISAPYNTHFSSPDTLVPDQYNTLDYDRYQYARANPVKYSDPSGHMVIEEPGSRHGCSNPIYCKDSKPKQNLLRQKNGEEQLWSDAISIGDRCAIGDFQTAYCGGGGGLKSYSLNRIINDGECTGNLCSFAGAGFPVNYSATYDVTVYENYVAMNIYEHYWFSGMDIPLADSSGQAQSSLIIETQGGVQYQVPLGEFKGGPYGDPTALHDRNSQINFYGTKNFPANMFLRIDIVAENIGHQSNYYYFNTIWLP